MNRHKLQRPFNETNVMLKYTERGLIVFREFSKYSDSSSYYETYLFIKV